MRPWLNVENGCPATIRPRRRVPRCLSLQNSIPTSKPSKNGSTRSAVVVGKANCAPPGSDRGAPNSSFKDDRVLPAASRPSIPGVLT